MLREAVAQGTELGKTAKGFMDRGELVPDELVIRMLAERISRPDAEAGFVLDGFPRTLAQALALDDALSKAGKAIDLALNIVAPDEELVKRLSGRWICRSCGAIYHEVTNPPEITGRCDKCGGELYQRDDDKPETVRARLEQQKTPENLLAHYTAEQKLVDINGLQTVEEVTAELLKAVERKPAEAG
jgi:adenylate kinase